MNTPKLSDQLREAIQKSGASLNQLGIAAGVHSSILSRFMRGERTLLMNTVERLLESLGCGVSISGEPSADSLKVVKRKRRRRRKDG
jgi:transcriptional regulator with XRE-family HTH domain